MQYPLENSCFRKDKVGPLVGFSALSFLQCFENVTWEGHPAHKNPWELSPKILFQNKWRKKPRDWVTDTEVGSWNTFLHE